MGSNGAARPGASTAPPAVAATPAPTAAAPLASLAEIVSSIEIPPEEMAKPDNAVGADTLARLLEDKRKAEAAEAAKREKEEAAAKAKRSEEHTSELQPLMRTSYAVFCLKKTTTTTTTQIEN